MKTIPLLSLSVLAAACASREPPEPQIRLVEVQVPIAQPCDAAARLGPAPAYPDTDEALRGAADIFEQVRLLVAGRLMRIARGGALEDAIGVCSR